MVRYTSGHTRCDQLEPQAGRLRGGHLKRIVILVSPLMTKAKTFFDFPIKLYQWIIPCIFKQIKGLCMNFFPVVNKKYKFFSFPNF